MSNNNALGNNSFTVENDQIETLCNRNRKIIALFNHALSNFCTKSRKHANQMHD